MDTKKITVPESWQEVTIAQYQEIAALDQETPDGVRLVEMISILIDEDPEVIRHTDLESLNRIAQHLEWTQKLPDEAWYKPIITIDGIEYGFVPRLTELTVGEWIDLEHYVLDVNSNMHKIFSVLYRPLVTAFNDRDRIIEPYNSEDADRRADLFKTKAKIGDVYGALVFFSLIVNESTKTMQDYLRLEVKRMSLERKRKRSNSGKTDSRKKGLLHRIVRSGCGIVMRICWPEEKSQKWMQFLKQTLSSRSTTKRSSMKIKN